MKTKNIAIIIARGKSKRIPKKNIKNFCGNPIIKYSISSAINSGIFDEIMVSTDDLEIANLSKKFGANVPFFRSDENSNDFATTSEVLLEVLQQYKNLGKEYDNICCIYPTAPFITDKKLKMAYEKLQYFDCIIPIVKFSFPPQRSFVIKNNTLEYKWNEFENSRSQDLESFYHDCGQFYFIKTDKFLKYKKLIIKSTSYLEVSPMEAQDIDNIDDWKLAELKYLNMIKNDFRE